MEHSKGDNFKAKSHKEPREHIWLSQWCLRSVFSPLRSTSGLCLAFVIICLNSFSVFASYKLAIFWRKQIILQNVPNFGHSVQWWSIGLSDDFSWLGSGYVFKMIVFNIKERTSTWIPIHWFMLQWSDTQCRNSLHVGVKGQATSSSHDVHQQEAFASEAATRASFTWIQALWDGMGAQIPTSIFTSRPSTCP